MTSLLTVLAAATGAKAVVEVGTDFGATAIALRDGMRGGGVLTSIDPDAGAQRSAKEALAEGAGQTQVRLIAGAAREVLPRLADGAYDLIVVNRADQDAADYVTQAKRLLRPGGAFVLTDASDGGAAVDPGNRGAVAQALREASKQVREDEEFTATLVPAWAGGVLVAIRH